MKNINEYIEKVNQIAKKDENVKFMPVTKDDVNRHMAAMNDAVEDYKELKEIVQDFEEGISVAGREAAPVVVPIDSRRRK